MGPIGTATTERRTDFREVELVRRLSPSQRLALCFARTRVVVEASRRALRIARPDLDDDALLLEWARIQYGSVPGLDRRRT